MTTSEQRAPNEAEYEAVQGEMMAALLRYDTAVDVRNREQRRANRTGTEEACRAADAAEVAHSDARNALIIAIAKRVREGEGVKLDGPERVAVANLLHAMLDAEPSSPDYELWDSAWKKLIAGLAAEEAPHA